MHPGTEDDRDIFLEGKHPTYYTQFHKKRKQQFDRRGQYFSLTHNHYLGNKLPMAVKFPKISQFFETIPKDHPWSRHRLGIYNGLYVVPENVQGPFQIPGVKINNYDPLPEFFRTPKFKLLDRAFNLIYKKLSIVNGIVSLNQQNKSLDFTKDEDLIKYSKYHYILELVYFQYIYAFVK